MSHRKALRDQSALLRTNNLPVITSSYPKHNVRKIVKSFTNYARVKIKRKMVELQN